MHIKPTLVSDEFGEGFLSSGTLNVHGGTPADQCTNAQFWGCERAGNPNNIVNPIKSASLRTVHSFSFRYGTIEIRAKLPAGDWLWPSLWLMPKVNAYGKLKQCVLKKNLNFYIRAGTWPSSGEIDLAHARGNRQLFDGDDVNVGIEQVGQTLHFGPRWDETAWDENSSSHFETNQFPGTSFNDDFHVFSMVWTDESITFMVDGNVTGVVDAADGFWVRGGFDQTGRQNPWQRGTSMAPFDQEFYIIMNLAIGGTAHFNDGFRNEPTEKPWLNTSPRAAADFWQGRDHWLPTWNMGTDSSHLQVDYVRVWAL